MMGTKAVHGMQTGPMQITGMTRVGVRFFHKCSGLMLIAFVALVFWG